MPLYEYVCKEDGSVVELMRPMARADDPVEDPEGRSRTFTRTHSTFQAKSANPAPSGPAGMPGPGCACGNPHGPCSM